MKKIEHYSLADWDYAVPGPYISDDVFVSSPSSLAARKEAPFDREGWAMCKLDSAKNVFDGCIVSYIRFGRRGYQKLYWYFRAQAYPPTATGLPDNCYYIYMAGLSAYLRRRVAAADTALTHSGFVPELVDEQWRMLRHTWWQYLQPDMTKLLRHRLEHYYNGAWILVLQYDDSQNRWADSAVNKVGFNLLHGDQKKPIAIDNSEIWKRLT